MAKTVEERRADKAEYMRRKRAENPEKYRALARDFNVKHNERIRTKRNAQYEERKADITAARRGTTKDVLDAVLAVQGGVCPVCETPLAQWPSRKTHVDHCHDTGRVRGLLCNSCNWKEGWVRRYGARLQAYLAAPPADVVRDLV